MKKKIDYKIPVSAKVDKNDAEKLNKIIDKSDLNISRIIRRALQLYLESDEVIKILSCTGKFRGII